MIVTLESAPTTGESWLIVNGIPISLTFTQKTALLQSLGPAREVDEPEPGYYRYFFN